VQFIAHEKSYTDIVLSGPAQFVFKGTLNLWSLYKERKLN
jgi:hypothetical protein